MEDRFSAIRAAIGTAKEGDVVVVVGRGHVDAMQYGDGEGGTVTGWLDDRQECRNALEKLHYLNAITKLDRGSLPWGSALDEMSTISQAQAAQGRD
jgi:UDP-N-acetylmuramoyl-L-alanyl-D-glutamate--2,6-diaminopimelate ligase